MTAIRMRFRLDRAGAGRNPATCEADETERERAIAPEMADTAGPPADLLPERFRAWFARRGWSARTHQLEMVAKGREGRDALLIAPTGGGESPARGPPPPPPR